VLFWAAIRVGCPNNRVSPSEVQNKAIEVNGFTVPQLFFNMYSCTRPVMAETMWEDQQSADLELSRMSACKNCLAVVLLHRVRELYRHIVAQNKLNCRGSRPHSRLMHQEGVVSLTPRILFYTVNIHFWTGLSISLPCFKELPRFGSRTC